LQSTDTAATAVANHFDLCQAHGQVGETATGERGEFV
jgi:hypothetical protein